MRTALAALTITLALAIGASAQQFTPTKQATAPDGVKATCDLPTTEHMRNTGGIGPGGPGTGAGLCVFTSAEHSARWQNISELYGLQKYMTTRPGGGWPEKLDQVIAAYCREKRVAVPRYIQHTGGDDTFLDGAVKTDRLVCVTYDGRDDYYRDRANRPVQIAHMVNLAHIDAKWAAIIDNNRPGVWVWMSRADFLSRWRGNGGGWAVVFLNPPPPPHPERKAFQAVESTDLPVFGQQCGPNGCPIPSRIVRPAILPQTPLTPVEPTRVAQPESGQWIPNVNGREWGYWVGGRAVAACFLDGRCEATNEYGIATGIPIDPPAPLPFAAGGVEAAGENYGVDNSKIHSGTRYTLAGGLEISRERAHALLGEGGLTDDSDYWHLTAVGDADLCTAVRRHVTALPAEVRDKLHLQCYNPAAWPVAHFSLPAGVSLRRPSPQRTAAEVGSIAGSDYTEARLKELLAAPGGPTHRPKPTPTPAPQPTPQPDPNNGPNAPSPNPPAPAVPANTDLFGCGAACAAILLLVLHYLKRKVT